jgi:hypothetical protein
MAQTTIPIIDIAVIKQAFSDAVVNTMYSINVDLYPKNGSIDYSDFNSLFYNNNIFTPINPLAISTSNSKYSEFLDIISLGAPKELSGNELELAEQVILRIEAGLVTTRDFFTPCSIINLTKSLQELKYFYNITNSGNNSISCSLDWSQILTLVKSLAPSGFTSYDFIFQITLVLNPTTMPSSTTAGVQPFSLVYQFKVNFDLTAI